MKIIIVGCGKIGQKLTGLLSEEEDIDVTVVDLKHPIVKSLINQYDVIGVAGSGSSLDILVEAGIEEADILIAVTGSDEVNLLTCLLAKKASGGKCQTIARVRKPEYNKEIALFKEDLALAMVINPERAAATEIARVLRFPSAIQIDTFAKGRIEILTFKVAPGSCLDNMKIADMSSKLNCDILVCGIKRGQNAFIPGGDFVIRSGDAVSIIASLKNATQFFKTIGVNTNSVKDTIIVGGGKIAYYLANMLIQSGIDVKIIEQNTQRCEELCDLVPKAIIINGDGTDNNILMEEGLEDAQSFVALTNIDEENILLSLYARSKMKGKLVTKINRIAYDEVISHLDLDSVIYPKDITAEYILRFVRAKNNSLNSAIETMHYIMDEKAEALEFRISSNSPVVGIPLEKLNLKKNIIVASIYRNGKVILPRGKDEIKEGDTVIVITSNKGYEDISDILESRKPQ